MSGKRAYLARYRYNARAAATISWDDGSVEDIRLVGLLNRLGLKGTFSIAPGLLREERRLTTWGEVWGDRHRPRGFPLGFLALEDLPIVYRGHEVAAHTLSHPDLTRLSFEAILHEVTQAKVRLEEATGQRVIGFVYPHGRYNESAKEAVRQAGYLYARTTDGTKRLGLPRDLMAMPPTTHWRRATRSLFLKTLRARGVFHIYGHGYEMRTAMHWRRLSAILGWMARSGCWCTTLGNIVRYDRARSRCTVKRIDENTWTVSNPTEQKVTVVVQGRGWLFVDGRPVDFATSPGWCEVPPGAHTVSLSPRRP